MQQQGMSLEIVREGSISIHICSISEHHFKLIDQDYYPILVKHGFSKKKLTRFEEKIVDFSVTVFMQKPQNVWSKTERKSSNDFF